MLFSYKRKWFTFTSRVFYWQPEPAGQSKMYSLWNSTYINYIYCFLLFFMSEMLNTKPDYKKNTSESLTNGSVPSNSLVLYTGFSKWRFLWHRRENWFLHFFTNLEKNNLYIVHWSKRVSWLLVILSNSSQLIHIISLMKHYLQNDPFNS